MLTWQCDTWQRHSGKVVQLVWTNLKVTCVTTERVTRGTLIQVAGKVSGHVADMCVDVMVVV